MNNARRYYEHNDTLIEIPEGVDPAEFIASLTEDSYSQSEPEPKETWWQHAKEIIFDVLGLQTTEPYRRRFH